MTLVFFYGPKEKNSNFKEIPNEISLMENEWAGGTWRWDLCLGLVFGTWWWDLEVGLVFGTWWWDLAVGLDGGTWWDLMNERANLMTSFA